MIFLAWILAFIISTFVITFHVSALNKATPLISQIGSQKSFYKKLLITSYILLIHFAEIIMFGILFFMLVKIDGAGEVIGAEYIRDYFYFSAANYTSLGYGDLYPQGYIRIFSGVEALVGLIMIGWTAAFTFRYITND
ncbi:MAG: ion channel [Methylococcales bacterium]